MHILRRPVVLWLVVGVYIACVGSAYLASRVPQVEIGVVGREHRLTPFAEYGAVAWLTANEIALLSGGSVPTSPSDRLSAFVYDLDTDKEAIWFFQKIPQCRILRVIAPKVVALGTMMYIEECRGDRPEMRLYQIQRHEDHGSLVYGGTIESGLAPIDYSLQPGENGRLVIGTLDYKFYDVTYAPPQEVARGTNEVVTRPAWSPSGLELAFWGGLSGDLPHSGAIRVLDPQYANGREVLHDVGSVSSLSWSANGDWLAFSGQYRSEAGVWAYNETAKRIVRIWSDELPFSWSPVDNDRLVVLEHGQNGTWALVEVTVPTRLR